MNTYNVFNISHGYLSNKINNLIKHYNIFSIIKKTTLYVIKLLINKNRKNDIKKSEKILILYNYEKYTHLRQFKE